jgi:hypothetical protein
VHEFLSTQGLSSFKQLDMTTQLHGRHIGPFEGHTDYCALLCAPLHDEARRRGARPVPVVSLARARACRGPPVKERCG